MNTFTWSRLASRCTIAMTIAGAVAGCSDSGGISNPFAQQPNATIQPAQVVGGGTKQMAIDAPVSGGFLPHPELLASGSAGQAGWVYFNPNTDFSTYSKVLMDPVSIWAGPNSDLNNVPADQQRDLANMAYSEVYNALSQNCTMVQTVSPGTIHLHFALVDTSEPNAVLNTVATYAPYASSAYSLASFAFNKGVGYFSGTATGEGFATDASSGALLWEAADKRGGTTAVVANTLDNWRDARHIFESWGILLRERLQKLGVCHA